MWEWSSSLPRGAGPQSACTRRLMSTNDHPDAIAPSRARPPARPCRPLPSGRWRRRPGAAREIDARAAEIAKAEGAPGPRRSRARALRRLGSEGPGERLLSAQRIVPSAATPALSRPCRRTGRRAADRARMTRHTAGDRFGTLLSEAHRALDLPVRLRAVGRHRRSRPTCRPMPCASSIARENVVAALAAPARARHAAQRLMWRGSSISRTARSSISPTSGRRARSDAARRS